MHDFDTIPIFGSRADVPHAVGPLWLSKVTTNQDPAIGTDFRYDAETERGGWLGANAFIYLRAGHGRQERNEAIVQAERDGALGRLRVGAVDPVTLGTRVVTLVAPGGERLCWAWAALRDRPGTDAVVTHVAVRSDFCLTNKVLFSYPATIEKLGRQAMTGFLIGWHLCLQQARRG